MAKSFGELVNDAIAESKVSLDPLTPANFLVPPRTVMYTNFKRWINMAYKELFMKRKEWQPRTQRTVVSIWPRIHLAGLTYTPSIGDVLVGQSSGVILTVNGVHSFEDPTADAVEYTLSVQPSTGFSVDDLILKEQFNITSPTVASNVGYLKGAGFYNFRELVLGLESIDVNTVRVHELAAEAAADGLSFPSNSHPVFPVMWDKWMDIYQGRLWSGDNPQYITINPQGFYELFPQPDTEALLSFDYTASVQPLVNYTDIPKDIKDEYMDYIMWRAVQEFADFDSNGKLFMRASKHTNEYLYWLDRDNLPPVRVETSRFYTGRSQGYFD
jgi:hypothetical protein